MEGPKTPITPKTLKNANLVRRAAWVAALNTPERHRYYSRREKNQEVEAAIQALLEDERVGKLWLQPGGHGYGGFAWPLDLSRFSLEKGYRVGVLRALASPRYHPQWKREARAMISDHHASTMEKLKWAEQELERVKKFSRPEHFEWSPPPPRRVPKREWWLENTVNQRRARWRFK